MTLVTVQQVCKPARRGERASRPRVAVPHFQGAQGEGPCTCVGTAAGAGRGVAMAELLTFVTRDVLHHLRNGSLPPTAELKLLFSKVGASPGPLRARVVLRLLSLISCLLRAAPRPSCHRRGVLCQDTADIECCQVEECRGPKSAFIRARGDSVIHTQLLRLYPGPAFQRLWRGLDPPIAEHCRGLANIPLLKGSVIPTSTGDERSGCWHCICDVGYALDESCRDVYCWLLRNNSASLEDRITHIAPLGLGYTLDLLSDVDINGRQSDSGDDQQHLQPQQCHHDCLEGATDIPELPGITHFADELPNVPVEVHSSSSAAERLTMLIAGPEHWPTEPVHICCKSIWLCCTDIYFLPGRGWHGHGSWVPPW